MLDDSVKVRAAGSEDVQPVQIRPELREKLHHRDSVHGSMSEKDVQGLEYVDLSRLPYRHVKRVLDLVLALLGTAILLLPMLLVLLAVVIDDPGAPLFRQWRIGKDGKRFRILKIRSMRRDMPKYVSTADVADPDRCITRMGKILRKTSLDEMPQLLNVIKGDMSLIGPRPLIPGERGIHQMRRRFGVYQLRPGITGLAQINGRDNVSPEEKVRWDVRYLENMGFLFDVKIFLRTVLQVLNSEGVVEGRAGRRRFGRHKAH